MQSHFKKYGEIIDAVIMKDRSTGHPRGFGFVTFADPAVCDNVVLDKHVIDGRTVSSSRVCRVPGWAARPRLRIAPPCSREFTGLRGGMFDSWY